MSKTTKCTGCSMCGQRGGGTLVKQAARHAKILGTLGQGSGGLIVPTIHQRPCMFCGHRLEFHRRLSIGQ
jgi:hypothetical protein